MTVTLHRATADDLAVIAKVDERAFGFHYEDTDLDDIRLVFEPDRFLLARDGAQVAGVAGSYPLEITPPGGAPIPAAGVTWVSVTVTHRRRGILRAMLGELHRGYVADGVPVALLTASEGGIYGRFGYGVTTTDRRVEIDRKQAVLRPGTPDPGGVRYAEPDEVAKLVPDIHRRWCARRPGAISRSEGWWQVTLLDRPHQRRGATARFHLLHDDGYVAYRMESGTCKVVDFFAVTDEAALALWRVLLALDLVSTITTDAVCVDDPLPWLLTDARAVRTTSVADCVWAKVLDTPAVLAARRYAVDVDAVLEVHDPDGFAGGRFRLRGGPDGAECALTDAAPDVTIDVPALGALAFGGARAHALARAGRIVAGDEALLRRLDAACVADREPYAGTHF